MAHQFVDQQYMQLCSEKTLQTNSAGFFLQFADAVAETVGEKWIKNTFARLKTDKDRIRKVYQDEKIQSCVVGFLSNVQEVYRKKSIETSRKRRLEAEASYRKDEFSKALNLYSQSILRGLKSDENFALALFGRSQVLISMKEYANALTDIQECLKENLLNIHKAEAFIRMGQCYRGLSEENKAEIAFNVAGKCAGNNKKLVELLDKTRKIQQEIYTKKAASNILPSIEEKHPKFKFASKKISVKKSEDLGRYVVANEEIKTGETIVVEPAYAACLLPEKFGTHCHNCFERLLSPFPCPDCSSVAFCKPQCRDSAISTYHKYECKFLDLLIGSGMSILGHTALRIITQNALTKNLEIYKNRSKEKLYNLCTNGSKRPAGDFLQRTLMASFLLRCLQKSGYFEKESNSPIPTEEEYRIGEMLLFNLQVLQFNAHEIYETLCAKENRLKGAKPAYIGVAVYPTVALFNHDCYPAVTRYFVGRHIVVNAVRPLSPDDVIAENYGPVFTCRKLIERQRSLSSRYWFNCKCFACLEDWPGLNGLSSLIKRVRCPTDKCHYLFSLSSSKTTLKCPSCSKDVSLAENIDKLKWCEGQYKLAMKYMDEKEKEKAIRVLCPALDTFHRVSAAPHRETHLAQEVLRVCLADSGNSCECLVKTSN